MDWWLIRLRFSRLFGQYPPAFNPKLNHFGVKLKALYSSDIGHWDVPDMTKVLVEAHELVDDGFIDPHDFRDFSYANVVRMHTGMNPDFFTGTVLESQANAVMGRAAAAA